MSNRSPPPRNVARQDVLPGLGPSPDNVAAKTENQGQEFWADCLRQALAERSPQARDVAEEALRAWPASQELLLLAALAALAEVRPERALVLLKRYGKRYGPGKPAVLLTALGLAQQGQPARAWAMLQEAGLHTGRAALPWFVGDDVMEEWLYAQLHRLRMEQPQHSGRAQARAPRPSRSEAAPPPAPPRSAKRASFQTPAVRPPPARAPKSPVAVAGPVLPEVADLPRLEARFDMAFEIANADAIEIAGSEAAPTRPRSACAPSWSASACSRASTSCSACRRCTAWRRTGIRSRPCARC